MSLSTRARFLSIARAFRVALVASRSDLPLLLGAFPRGACGTASEMLGYFLLTEHGHDSQLVCSERYAPDFCSHSWLVVDGEIVDLTADQFADFSGPVPHIGGDAWHTRWEVTSKHLVSETNFGPMFASWGVAYETIAGRARDLSRRSQ
jgi:hypothetical protein